MLFREESLDKSPTPLDKEKDFLKHYFGELECVGLSFAYVDHFVFLRDVWIRNQRVALANRRATNLATRLPCLATRLPT